MDGEDDEIPLVGEIYRKCASFFSEIDNIISQESIEYAENQLRIAGANAKKACSKFMQETFPDFLMNSLQEASPAALEENGFYEVPVSEMLKGDKDHANGQRISSSSSTEDELGDTQPKQTGDDLVGEKDINTDCTMPTPKMHALSTGLKSISTMAIERKCDCPEVNESEDEDASACPRRKHQRQNSEESEWQDGDFSDSDWEII